MPFDWRNYVELAKALQAAGVHGATQEAIDRSIVSRAYYGAFCCARNYTRDFKDFKPTGYGGDHSALRRWLHKHKFAHVAQRLNDLQVWRENCDYDDNLNLDLTDLVGQAIKHAEYVMREIPMSK